MKLKYTCELSAFLGRHGFIPDGIDVGFVTDGLLYDMEMGLNHQSSGVFSDASAQAMIPVWITPPNCTLSDKKVIVIDAGGTNFRSCLVSFDNKGVPNISDMEKTSMPAIEREYSQEEFYDAIAKNIEHLKDKAHAIGFCFSYAMEIQRDGDGRVMEFSKEVKAPDVEGSLVGDCLFHSLAMHGWKNIERITMLNDTTAALLAGAASTEYGKKYSSYAGFILGTGMNSAYIESEKICKLSKVHEVPVSQIVVTEVGSYNRLPRNDFDIELDKHSVHCGKYIMEKMCSGAYLGPLASIAVRYACEEGLFSSKFCEALNLDTDFSLLDMDKYLYMPFDKTTRLGRAVECGCENDRDMLYSLLDVFIERAARLAAAAIAAVVIKSGEGQSPARPVRVLCNGTTFHKTHLLKERIAAHLTHELVKRRCVYCELSKIENDITLGAAVAALSPR